MDNIDARIINLLQENSRISISEISKNINLSISAVSERLKKLENTKVIKKYTAILNPEALNKELTAIMYISLESPKYTDKFLEFIHPEREILECHYIAGLYDYSLKIITKNTNSLEKLLHKIKSVPGIKKTQTNVVLSTIKNEYSVSPDK